jgi:hypothetical protein
LSFCVALTPTSLVVVAYVPHASQTLKSSTAVTITERYEGDGAAENDFDSSTLHEAGYMALTDGDMP